MAWARKSGIDAAAVKRRVRFIGITHQQRTSPKTWRWHQHTGWARQFRPSAIKNVSMHPLLFSFLANAQVKSTPANPPWRWGSADLARSPRASGHLEALRLAHDLYTLGTRRARRLEFSRLLAKQPAMRHRWFRTLVSELRAGARP